MKYGWSLWYAGVLAIGFAFSAVGAGTPPDSLDDMRTVYQQHQQTILISYGTALEALKTEMKRNGDLDSYLVVDAEKKRFDIEKTVAAPGDAKVPFRSAVESYHKASVVLIRKYMAALDRLVKLETTALCWQSLSLSVSTTGRKEFHPCVDLLPKTPDRRARIPYRESSQ